MRTSGKKFIIIISIVLVMAFLLQAWVLTFDNGSESLFFSTIQDHMQSYVEQVQQVVSDCGYLSTIKISDERDTGSYCIDINIQTNIDTQCTVFIRASGSNPYSPWVNWIGLELSPIFWTESFSIHWSKELTDVSLAMHEYDLELTEQIFKTISGKDVFNKNFLSEFLADPHERYNFYPLYKGADYVRKNYFYGLLGASSPWGCEYHVRTWQPAPVVAVEDFFVYGVPKLGQRSYLCADCYAKKLGDDLLTIWGFDSL